MSRALPRSVAIVGAGWAGLAAAVAATQAGLQVTLYEAAREPGGRARTVHFPASVQGQLGGPAPCQVPGDLPESLALDNGQHILIGAYRASLGLLRSLGLQPEQSLLRLPLDLRDAQGRGMVLPNWPAALQTLAGAWAIANATGWHWASRWALLRAVAQWQRQGFQAPQSMTVAQLCQPMPAELIEQFVDPLCVAALNTPIEQASAQVFLRVLQDSLLGGPGSADMLLPTKPLGDVLAQPALQWLQERGAQLVLGRRVDQLARGRRPAGAVGPLEAWHIEGQYFDALVLACPAWEAARLLSRWVQADGYAASGGQPARAASSGAAAASVQEWLHLAQQLQYEAIGTVYLQSDSALLRPPLPRAMLAVQGGPAQFAFDRQRLTGDKGLTAWVASTLRLDKSTLTKAVLQQAAQVQVAMHAQGLADAVHGMQPIATIIEKRATFRCIAALPRPGMQVDARWPSLLACGDYLQGPYPATLEAAVLSGQAAAAQLCQLFGKAGEAL